MQKNKILIVHEDKKVISNINDILGKDFEIAETTPREAANTAASVSPHIVVLDNDMKNADAVELYKKLKRQNPKIKAIMISSSSDVAPAVFAAKKGIDDYLMKPIEKERFTDSIKRLLHEEDIVRSNIIMDVPGSEWLKGASREVKDLINEVSIALNTDSDVIIFGEKGINKSSIASMLHLSGRNPERKFVEINLSSFERDDTEAYFWGSLKELLLQGRGEFSGQEDMCGTLFLSGFDSIGEHFGESIIKFLKERKADSDVRVVISIEEADRLMNMEKEDLLSGFKRIYVPSLRQRKADIPILVNHYLKMLQEKYSKPILGVSGDVLELFLAYNWPGNYEELKDVLSSAVLCSKEKMIGLKELPITLNFISRALSEKALLGNDLTLGSLRRDFERSLIRIFLEKSDWDSAKVSQMLDIPRPVFEERIKELGLVEQK